MVALKNSLCCLTFFSAVKQSKKRESWWVVKVFTVMFFFFHSVLVDTNVIVLIDGWQVRTGSPSSLPVCLRKVGKIVFIVFVFYYHFAIHTKYTYKIFKKDEAREPKEANKACVWDQLLELCYLINNYNTDIGNLTLSTHNLFGT